MTSNVLVVDTTVNSTSHTVNLTAGRQYRWNVNARNAAGGSAYTSQMHFQTPSAVTTPSTPANPSPGSTTSPGPTLSSSTVTLNWNASSGATSYGLAVRDMTSNVLVVDTTVSSTSHTVNLTAGRQYRWNVNARNAAGGSAYTSQMHFQTPSAVTIPSTPSNPSPGSISSPGPTLSSSTVTLSWSASSGATSYGLAVRDMTSNVLIVDTTVTSTSHTVNLTAGRQYRWNVNARNAAGGSAYTSQMHFQTPSAVTTPSTPANPSPGSTTSPGPTLSSSTVTLNWNASSGATSYGLAVRDVAANTLVVDTILTSTSHTVNLTAGRQYRWNVNARNAAGGSAYTSQMHFQTPAAQFPDFVVSSLSINPATAAPGASVTVNVTIRNNGNGPAPAGSLCRIRLSSTTTITTSDPLLDEFTVGALNANGGQQSFTRTVVIPSSTIVGSRFIGATANASSAGPTESNGTNNQATTPISIQWSSSTAPQIASVTPNPIVADAANAFQTLTIDGSNFVDKPIVILTWTGQTGHTLPASRITYINNTRLSLSIQLGRISDTWSVQVRNPNNQTSNIRSFTVTAAPPSGPGSFTLSNEAPTTLTTGPAVRLNWTTSGGATSYEVFRDGLSYFPGLIGLTFLNSANLTTGRTYSYQVRARNAGGIRDSNIIQVAVPSSSSVGPAVFTLSNDPAVWDSQAPAGPAVHLRWTASTGATSYQVFRDQKLIYPLTGTYAGAEFRNNTSLQAGVTYLYHIVATNSLGTRASNTIRIQMPYPPRAAPGSLTLANEQPFWDTKIHKPSVRLNWSPSSQADQYEVWKNGVKVFPAKGTALSLTWLDTASTAGSTVRYTILARNSMGEQRSNEVSVTLPSSPDTPISVPGAFVLRAEFSGWDSVSGSPLVTLTWSASSGSEFYQVLRSGALIHNAGSEISYVVRTGLAPSKIYSFQIRALNSRGSMVTQAASVTVPPKPSGPLPTFEIQNQAPYLQSGASQPPAVRIQWQKVGGALGYDIYRDDARIHSGLKTTSALLTSGLSHGATHAFQVVAVGIGNSVVSNRLQVVMPFASLPPPSAPVLSNAPPTWVEGVSPGPNVRLTWTRASNVASYTLLRDGQPYATGLPGLEYSNIKNLFPGGTYRYKVIAVNPSGQTASNEITVLMPDGPPSGLTALPLVRGVPSGLIRGNTGTSFIYAIPVPANLTELTIMSITQSGDVDLYLHRGSIPKIGSTWTWSAQTSSGNEEIRIAAPVAGTYFLRIIGVGDFANTSIRWNGNDASTVIPMPTFSLSPGSYSYDTDLFIRESTNNTQAEIRYTLNGAEPTMTTGYRFSADTPIKLWQSMTIRARVFVPNAQRVIVGSPTNTHTYNVDSTAKDVNLSEDKKWTGLIDGEKTFLFDVPDDNIQTGQASVSATAAVEVVVVTRDSSNGKVRATLSRSNSNYGNIEKFVTVFHAKSSEPAWTKYNETGQFDPLSVWTRNLTGRWTLKVQTLRSGPQSCEVSFLRIPVELSSSRREPIVSSKPTWIICHGRTDSFQGMSALATGVEKRIIDGQVLLIDWKDGAASNIGRGLQGTRFIRPVATKLQQIMSHLQIGTNQTHWIGHSWGSLVGYQFGTYPLMSHVSGSGARPLMSYIALDPAAGRKGILGDDYPDHNASLKNATDNTGRTMAFVGIDQARMRGNGSGDEGKTESADHSIIVRFNTDNISDDVSFFDRTFRAIHSGVHRVYTAILEGNRAQTGSLMPTNLLQLNGSRFSWMSNQFKSNGDSKKGQPYEAVIDATLSTLSSGSVTNFSYITPNGISVSEPLSTLNFNGP